MSLESQLKDSEKVQEQLTKDNKWLEKENEELTSQNDHVSESNHWESNQGQLVMIASALPLSYMQLPQQFYRLYTYMYSETLQ